jgi:hypothetical protein
MKLSFHGKERVGEGASISSRSISTPRWPHELRKSLADTRSATIRKSAEPSRLVHGEEKQALSLTAAIQAEHPKIEVTVPHVGSNYEV